MRIVKPTPQRHRDLQLVEHSRRIHALAKALAKALDECHRASSWPGDRLPVSHEAAEKVERLTRRIQLETEAYLRVQARLLPAT